MTTEQSRPTKARPYVAHPPPGKQQILERIDALGLNEHLVELEVQGFTVLPGALSPDLIERAKAALVRRAESVTGNTIDPETATPEAITDANYLAYVLFDDPVFPEILLQDRPLALIHYLLGEQCVLSSMGSHFRGPGGLPLIAHLDGLPDECLGETALTANINYGLTPYTQEAGALILFPGSHRKQRQPTAHENWTLDGKPIASVMAEGLPDDVDTLEWTPPPGGVTIELQPGDAAIWHGNSWHAGWRRDIAGVRINLAAYFCRKELATQEDRGDDRYPEVFERYADDPRFAQLMGKNRFNGWREEGPNLAKMRREEGPNLAKMR